jgi:hypothetical protein
MNTAQEDILTTTASAIETLTASITPQPSLNSASMSAASFIYPTSVLTVNNIDVVEVGYQSSWTNVNITVFCELARNSNEFALAKMNEC